MAPSNFTTSIIKIVKSIPYGKVCTYGQIADIAGNNRAARQVTRILHIYGKKENLPWHRVINKSGKISLKQNQGYERQYQLLKNEGILFTVEDKIDLKKYLWEPSREWIIQAKLNL